SDLIATHQTLDLRFAITIHDDQLVESLVAAGFYQQGGIDYRDAIRIASFSFGEQTVLLIFHPGGNDLVQKHAPSVIGKDYSPHLSSIDRPVRAKNLFSELSND